MIFCSFGELKLLEFDLPTHKTKEVVRVYEEIEESLGFGQKDVLEIASHCSLKVRIGGILDRRTNCPNQRPSAYHIQSLHVLLVTVCGFSLLKKSFDQQNQTLRHLQLCRRHRLGPILLEGKQS